MSNAELSCSSGGTEAAGRVLSRFGFFLNFGACAVVFIYGFLFLGSGYWVLVCQSFSTGEVSRFRLTGAVVFH